MHDLRARRRVEQATLAAVERFNEAFDRHDVDALLSCMTPDCVFENTVPPPDGARHVGREAVAEIWRDFFAASPLARFETEEVVVAGDRCVVRWIYRWGEEGDDRAYVRGVDLFRVADGLIAEKLSYVKG